MVLTLIVAASENNVIGNRGKIPWHLPADLRRFRKLTEGHTVIMGRKTHESIGHPLPKRRNIVVTRQKSFQAEGCEVVGSLEEAVAKCENAKMRKCENRHGSSSVLYLPSYVFVIGGAEIYAQALPLADRIELTRVHATFEGDAFFPEILEQEWREVARERHEADAENPHAYTFLKYEQR